MSPRCHQDADNPTLHLLAPPSSSSSALLDGAVRSSETAPVTTKPHPFRMNQPENGASPSRAAEGALGVLGSQPGKVAPPSAATGGVHASEDLLPSNPSNASLLERRDSALSDGYSFNWISSHLEFLELVQACQAAIDGGVAPDRISQGSSGSYFVKNAKGKIVGVFKPKDEEPYGQLNPKWIKWMHRTCFPCFFGRSFLLPNTGYVSEAAASLVDTFLNLGVVPRTQVAHLGSAAFVYPWWTHYRVWSERRQQQSQSEVALPVKLGSFQLFVEGFEDSTTVLARMEQMRPLPAELRSAFQLEFERMTVLDYVIRNSDRTMDNWLVHLSWADERPAVPQASMEFRPSVYRSAQPSASEVRLHRAGVGAPKHGSEADLTALKRVPRLEPRVKIACIDNGLAFPFKHPNEWRSYPFSWASLPEARVPYSSHTRDSLLAILSNPSSWELLVGRLKQIFQIDSDFNESVFKKQMAILRGQLYNLVQSLQRHESPAELLVRPLVLIEEDDDLMSHGSVQDALPDPAHATRDKHRHRHTPVTAKPLFSCW